MNDEPAEEPQFDKPPVPRRKANGPGRERKQKARRTSRRKQGGNATSGMHRRGSKRRSS